MRHVAALAAFLTHRSMLESERTALVAVTVEAAGFIGVRHAHQAGFEAAVRIVAIHALHGILGNPVFERLRERRFHIDVAALALGIDLRRFARHQSLRPAGMNRMTRGTRDGVAGMAGFEAARGSRLISMTSETSAIGF